MLAYYDGLVKARNEMQALGETGSNAYELITKEIEALTPAIDTFNEESEAAHQTFAQDLDTRIDNGELEQPTSMVEYMQRRQDLLDNIKEDYNVLSEEEAAHILNLSDTVGQQEKLFQSWQNLSEKTQNQAAEYYDNLGVYRDQFGATLDYSGAVGENGDLDTDYLNNQLSERVED